LAFIQADIILGVSIATLLIPAITQSEVSRQYNDHLAERSPLMRL